MEPKRLVWGEAENFFKVWIKSLFLKKREMLKITLDHRAGLRVERVLVLDAVLYSENELPII